MISNGSSPPLSWSHTTTILIHKKNTDPCFITNLHPITLSNTDIKLLSSILASRFQSYAHFLIHPFQTGFMKKRNIYDTILDINSYLTIPNPPPEAFVLSVDWSKAYDRVSHSWLDYVLQQSSFPLSFIHLTHCSYHNCTSSIKINNFLSTPFPVLQGVPQGDPLAPLLFNLSIQPLFNLIMSVPTLTLRAYADDTTIIGHTSNDLSLLLNSIFPLYLSITGGQINIQKSSLYPLSPLTFPSIPNSPPISSTLNILCLPPNPSPPLQHPNSKPHKVNIGHSASTVHLHGIGNYFCIKSWAKPLSLTTLGLRLLPLSTYSFLDFCLCVLAYFKAKNR